MARRKSRKKATKKRKGAWGWATIGKKGKKEGGWGWASFGSK